jgi:AbrB family looped-hinge helix DNA binding protein
MDTVVITSGFGIRIPRRAREALGLAPGQRLRVVQYPGRIELMPFRPPFECAALFGPPPDEEGSAAGAAPGRSAVENG